MWIVTATTMFTTKIAITPCSSIFNHIQISSIDKYR